VKKRALRILLDHNLPFILWSAAACFKILVPGQGDGLLVCPVLFFLGRCPGCELTAAYVGFLRTGRADAWFGLVFGLFLLNFFISLRRARRALDTPALDR